MPSSSSAGSTGSSSTSSQSSVPAGTQQQPDPIVLPPTAEDSSVPIGSPQPASGQLDPPAGSQPTEQQMHGSSAAGQDLATGRTPVTAASTPINSSSAAVGSGQQIINAMGGPGMPTRGPSQQQQAGGAGTPPAQLQLPAQAQQSGQQPQQPGAGLQGPAPHSHEAQLSAVLPGSPGCPPVRISITISMRRRLMQTRMLRGVLWG